MSDPASGRGARRPRRLRLCTGITVFISLLCGCGLFTHGGPHPAVQTGAQTSAQADTAGPRVRLERTAWNFGTIARGDTARSEIAVANEGSDSLRLTLHTACICLTARAVPAVVPPHQSGRIELAFAGETVSEATSKTLFIDSNDPAEPRVTIGVSGAVVEGQGPHLVVEPDPLWIERQRSDAAGPVSELTLMNVGARDLVIKDVRCLGCSTDWTRFTLAPGESAQLAIGVTLDWSGSRWVEIESNDPATPLKKISLVGID